MDPIFIIHVDRGCQACVVPALFAAAGLRLALTLLFSLCLIHATKRLFLGTLGCDRRLQVDWLDPIAIDPAPASHVTLPDGRGSAAGEPLPDTGSPQCCSDPERLHGIRGYWTLRCSRHPHSPPRSDGSGGSQADSILCCSAFLHPSANCASHGSISASGRAGDECSAQ